MREILTTATVDGLPVATLNSIVVRIALCTMRTVRIGDRVAGCSACSGFLSVEPVLHIPTCQPQLLHQVSLVVAEAEASPVSEVAAVLTLVVAWVVSQASPVLEGVATLLPLPHHHLLRLAVVAGASQVSAEVVCLSQAVSVAEVVCLKCQAVSAASGEGRSGESRSQPSAEADNRAQLLGKPKC